MKSRFRATAQITLALIAFLYILGCKNEAPDPPRSAAPEIAATRPAPTMSSTASPPEATGTALPAAPVSTPSLPSSPPPTSSPAAAQLPAATRFRTDVAKDLPTTLPAGLAENSDIPKPTFPGMEKSIQKLFQGAYIAALQSPNDASKLGDLGMLFFRVGSAGDAVRCFERSATLEPKAFRWKYYLGLAREAAFDPDGAILAFKDAQALDPSYPGVHLHLGDLLVVKNDPAARGYYETALKMTPGDARIYYGLSRCDSAEKKKDSAFANLKKATQLEPQFIDAQRALARHYDEIGDKKQADICRAMAVTGGLPQVMKDPLYIDLVSRLASPEGILSLSNQLTGTGQVQQAIDILRRAIELNPREWDLHQQLGMILSQQNQPAEAIREFKAVITADPSRAMVRAALAQALIDLGQFKQAEQYLKEEVDKEGDTNAYGHYADFLLRVGKSDEAFTLFDTLVKKDPNQPMNQLGYIMALICQKKSDLAATHWQRLHMGGRGDRDLSDAFVNQACILMVQQAGGDSEGYSKRVLVPALMEQFADKIQDTGRSADARKIRNYIETIAHNADQLTDSGNVVPAIRLLQLTMPIDRGGALRDSMRNAFLALRKRGQDGANKFLGESLKHAEESADLAMTLSWILSTTDVEGVRNPAEAVRLAEMACAKTQRQNPEALDALAAAYAEAGRFDDAVKTQQAALAIAPKEGCAELATKRYQERLAQYQAKKPWHGH